MNVDEVVEEIELLEETQHKVCQALGGIMMTAEDWDTILSNKDLDEVLAGYDDLTESEEVVFDPLVHRYYEIEDRIDELKSYKVKECC